MPRTRWVVTAATVALISRVPIYFAHENLIQLQVLWHNEKGYVCGGRVRYAGRLTLGGAGWCALAGYFAPSWCYADRELRDLVVAEIGAGGIKRHELHGFPSGGACYVYGGVLHYGIGVSNPDDFPADWRWDGQRFVRLPKDEALKQRATFRYTDDLHKREGWKEERLYDDNRDFAFALTDTTATVRTVRPSPPGTERVWIRAYDVEEPIMVIEEAESRTTRKQYWSTPVIPDRYSRRY